MLRLPPLESVMAFAGTQGQSRVCAGHSLHLLAIRFLSVPKGSAVSWPHLGLAGLCFSRLNSLPSPRQVFLHCPCLCRAPRLLQPRSAADGDHPPDACPKFTSLRCLSRQGSPVRPHGSSQTTTSAGVTFIAPGGFGLHCAASVPALAGWRELLGERGSRQGKWQTGVALGQHQLQREQESSAPFPSTSLDPKTITQSGDRWARAALSRSLLRPWAALVARRQPFAAWPWVMGWLLLPGSAAGLPPSSPLAQAGTEPCHRLVTAAMRQGEVGDQARTWLLPVYLEGREAGQAGGQEGGGSGTGRAGSVLRQGCVPSQRRVPPRSQPPPLLGQALGPCCSASPVLCAAAVRWERSSFLTG